MQALLTLYMAGQLFLPGRIEHIVGFAGFRAAIEAVTGHLSTQALASQVSSARAAPRIEQAARRLGLVPAPATDTSYLDLARR